MTLTIKTISVTGTLNAPSQQIWDVIRRGSGVNTWMPSITACRLDGDAREGARRVCSMGEQQLMERIETIDDRNKVFQYRITDQTLMPIRNPLATMHVAEVEAGKSHLLWMLNFELVDEQAWSAVLGGITQMYRDGMQGLERAASQQ